MGLVHAGSTTHYSISYDDSLSAADGRDRAAALLGVCEQDYNLMADWFDGLSLPYALPVAVNIIGNPGVDKANFELWSFAVSSINGCSHCVVAHEHTLREAGVDREVILEALKAAAIVAGVAQAITAAETLAGVG